MAIGTGKNWPEGTKILVVEDSAPTAHLFSARLKMEGIEVLTARNGLEALEILGQEPISLVVTDLMMPGMDGYRLVHEIRQLAPPLASIPIIVVSSNQRESEQVRCFEAGADEYMTKPVSLPLLVERLYRLLRRSAQGA
ncbi:response regulator transcription factor [Holophaga foetida]|uniref:response regulator transcription factor n=1 Tax=Holophaga foetida TaxID=35839 RepID=UPI00024717AE|nr:response regulator [Holophaga foetida]